MNVRTRSPLWRVRFADCRLPQLVERFFYTPSPN
jgi:hypothetical protein